jgi:hypothetical protein
MKEKSILLLTVCLVMTATSLRCGDATKTRTSCTITSNIVFVNKDARKYAVALEDSTRWDDLAEITLSDRTLKLPAKADTVVATGTATDTVTISWKVEHYMPWEESVCSRSGEEISLRAKIYHLDSIKTLRGDTIIGKDTTKLYTTKYTDTLIKSITVPITCDGCVKTFTEAASDSASLTDSLQTQSESYLCRDTVTINLR